MIIWLLTICLCCLALTNRNLEQQAQAIFKSWFVETVNPHCHVGTIADLGEVVGGSTPSKAHSEYYTEHGIAWITPKDLSMDKSKFITCLLYTSPSPRD